MFNYSGYKPQSLSTVGTMNYGTPSPAFGLGSDNPASAFSLGSPVVPDVSVPQVNYLAAPSVGVTPAPVTSPVSVPTSVTNEAVKPQTPFSWGGAIKGMLVNEEGGFNLDGLDTIGKILGSVGSLYGAFKSYGIAQDSLALNKRAFETNLANTRKSYNTALEDRASTRGQALGGSAGSKYTSDYLNKHSL